LNGTPTWAIRPAGRADADALALVGQATFLESYAGAIDGQAIIAHCAAQHSAATYHDYFAKGALAWLVLLAPGDAPIGYAMTCPPELEQGRSGDVELKRIYLLSRFHGSGIASALMDTVVNASTGAIRLLLGVKSDNNRAIAYYAKHQFAQIGTRRFKVGNEAYDDFVLARTLPC
jgi:ribosomal protein S18 acetylase RimI-like enzyme